MKRFYKIFSLVLTVCVMALALCGCFKEAPLKDVSLPFLDESSKENGSLVESNSSKTETVTQTKNEIKTWDTLGNLQNSNGIATYHDGWIYYSADDGIYKVNNDGTNEHLIYPYPNDRLSASHLSVYGKWLYFELSDIAGKDRYVRIKTDGSLGSSFQIAYEDVFNFQIVNNYIYYVKGQTLHRANLNKTNDIELITHKCIAYGYQVTDNKIYFGDNVDVYEADLDGKNLKCYKGAGSQHMLIYKGKKYSSGGLDCENIDGSNGVDLTKDYGYNLVIQDDWLYYIDDVIEDDFKSPEVIYRMKIDGSNRQQLNDIYTMSFCVAGDWIYYQPAIITHNDDGTSSGYSEGLYRMKTDGSQNTKIE